MHHPLKLLVELDPDFLTKYLEWLYGAQNYVSEPMSDRQRMVFIFGVIRECFPAKRLRFLELFLSLNQDADTFEGLGIQSRGFGGTGSMVPVFEKKIEFLESVLPLLSTSAFLKHKLHVNNLITEWKQEIETENKKNFLGQF